MNILKFHEEDSVILALNGELNANTALELEKMVNNLPSLFNTLVLDCKGLYYLSSSGLKVILKVRKELAKQDANLTLRQVRDNIMEILSVAGFSSVLTSGN
ncbi:STAS domain-containing protein [Serratia sp. 22264]|uniref:STAS domain-containing protein n=1 Tax=Serratia sp. 22264 TaxID=3453897 RepID=UPI003F828208